MPFLLDKPEPGKAGRRGPKRLWTVHPAPTLSWSCLEGSEILDEADGPEAIPLFQAFRDALLWATVARTDRAGLFVELPDLGLPADDVLHRPISRIHRALAGTGGSAEAVAASASESISEWAASIGRDATEYLFAYLAARISDTDHERAFAAGRAARRQGRYRDAEAFFQRTIALARRADDDAGYASGYIGWAIMEEKLGNLTAARRKFVSAWRASKRGGLPELGAATRHNMIALALAAMNFAEGQRHIMRAYRLYGKDNVALFRLANDAGGFWSTFGHYSVALPLFECSLPRVSRPVERVAILANICRAAAGLGLKERYLEAWTECTKLEREAGEVMPDIYIELARGAQALGYRRRAEDLARQARTSANAWGSTAKAAAAESLIAEIRDGGRGEPAKEPPPEVAAFAARFVKRLRHLERRGSK